MTQRQQLLHLWTAEAALDSAVVAWAFYDGTDGARPGPPSTSPPYPTGAAALSDGWCLIQTTPPDRPTGTNLETGDLRYEAVFERRYDLSEVLG